MIRRNENKKRKQTRETTYPIEHEPIVISKPLIDILLQKTKKPADCIALYVFYYYTAKWQKTNQLRATTTFAAKGLGWSEARIRKTKKMLARIGLVEDIKHTVKGKIRGWYVKINFIWSHDKVDEILTKLKENHPMEKPQCGKRHSVEKSQANALSVIIINALRDNKYIKKEKNKKESIEKIDPLFQLFINKLPTHLQTQDVICSIYEFFEYRKENKNKIQSKITVTKLVNKIKDLDESDLIDCIDNSISKGWTGLFPPYQNNKPTKFNNNKNTHPNTSINPPEEHTHYYNPYGSHCAPLPDDYEEDDAYDLPGILDH